jgi:hypothetical protein
MQTDGHDERYWRFSRLRERAYELRRWTCLAPIPSITVFKKKILPEEEVSDLDRRYRNDPVILSGFLWQFPDSCWGSGMWGPSRRGSNLGPCAAALLQKLLSSSGTDTNRKPTNYWWAVTSGSQVVGSFGTDRSNPLPPAYPNVTFNSNRPQPSRSRCTGNTKTWRRKAGILKYLSSFSAEHLNSTKRILL